MSKLTHLLVRAFLPLAARHALVEGHGVQGLRLAATGSAERGTVRTTAPAVQLLRRSPGAWRPLSPEESP